MKIEITGSSQEDGVGVEVIDNNGNRHLVALEWDGEVAVHKTDDYPHDRLDRTLEEQKIMTQVENRAKLAAQMEFPDADILDPDWHPDQLDRAVRAIQSMDVDTFAREFRTLYDWVTKPETAAPDATRDNAEAVMQAFLVDDSDEVAAVTHPRLQYFPDDAAQTQLTERDREYEQRAQSGPETNFAIVLPPYDIADGAYEFPDGFQMLVAEHLSAQIRDCYYHVGEEPPEYLQEFDIVGKFVTAADDEYYQDFLDAKASRA